MADEHFCNYLFIARKFGVIQYASIKNNVSNYEDYSLN
jgi:hypothetical protein